MVDYQIDARRFRTPKNNELKVGHQGEASTLHRQGWFIQNLVGTVGRDAYQMKAPRALVLQHRHGLRYVLAEGGDEVGSCAQRDFDDQDDWTAEFQAPRDWSLALTAFVAWLVGEARSMVD